ncbi:hypothetical protein J6590_008268 [Homalodisca vitripennis]|nr:hypothetical protein J6590_008268 [Homalodisca vitripennis]
MNSIDIDEIGHPSNPLRLIIRYLQTTGNGWCPFTHRSLALTDPGVKSQLALPPSPSGTSAARAWTRQHTSPPPHPPLPRVEETCVRELVHGCRTDNGDYNWQLKLLRLFLLLVEPATTKKCC